MKRFAFGKLGSLVVDDGLVLDPATNKMQTDWRFVWWWPINWLILLVFLPFAMIGIWQEMQKEKKQ